MSGRAITCRELVELVTDYLEGALSPGERERFERHLGGCDGCGHYLQQMRQAIAVIGRLHEDDIAPPARESLLAAFRDWHAAGA
jgi:anti-sigma factor RsiW